MKTEKKICQNVPLLLSFPCKKIYILEDLKNKWVLTSSPLLVCSLAAAKANL